MPAPVLCLLHLALPAPVSVPVPAPSMLRRLELVMHGIAAAAVGARRREEGQRRGERRTWRLAGQGLEDPVYPDWRALR